MFKALDFFLYLLSDEAVQKSIKSSKDVNDLLGRLAPLLLRDYFKPDLKKFDRFVKESRSFRELAIKIILDVEEGKKDGSHEGGRVLQLSENVSSADSKVS